MNYFKKQKNTQDSSGIYHLSRREALSLVETSYLAATTALIWIALYYLPIGGAIFRLVLPLPLVLLSLRRGCKTGFEGLILTILLLVALMGPVRGPLILFPYGLLSFWLGWSWSRKLSWWLSWLVGVFIGTVGFLVRVLALSLLVGENLWVVITRAGAGLAEKFFEIFNLSMTPDMWHIQLVAIFLVVFQELIYVLCLHVLSFWIFPRLKAHIPYPPKSLKGLVSLDSF